jgi:hypothetical protein
VIRQAPNLIFAAIAIYYLAKQNQRALEAMTTNSERQFALLEKLCARCNDQSPS